MKKMRSLYFFLSLIFIFNTWSYAGEIHLLDKTIIEGTKIEILNTMVNYLKSNGKETGTIKIDRIKKIVYDNGTVLEMREKNPPWSCKGVIFLHSGKNIQFETLADRGSYVEYIPRGQSSVTEIKREEINDINYGDPEKLILARIDAESREEKRWEEYYRESENKIPNNGFHTSIIWLSFFGGFGSVDGDYNRYEDNLYDENKETILDETITYYDLYDYYYFFGIDMSVLLFTIKTKQKSAFNLTGIHMGIKGRYLDAKIHQEIENDPSGDEEEEYSKVIFSGNLMTFQSWQAGPVVDLILSPRHNNFDLVFHAFCLGGKIFDGEINAVPVLRDGGVEFSKTDYSSGLTGNIYTLGTGIYFVVNRVFPVTVGANFHYTKAKLILDRELLLYENQKKLEYRSYGIEFSAGIHL